MLLKVAKVDAFQSNSDSRGLSKVPQAAFRHSITFAEGKRVSVVKMHGELVARLTRDPVGATITKYLPMLTEPIPWTGFREGGFLEQRVSAVRMKAQNSVGRDYINAAAASGDMAQVFAAIDVLGRTPWRINQAVLKVMQEVWNTEKLLPTYPPRTHNSTILNSPVLQKTLKSAGSTPIGESD